MVGEIYGIAAKNGWSVSMSVKTESAVMTFSGKPSAVWLLASPLRSKMIRSAALRMRLYLLRMQSIPTFVLGNG